MEKLGKTSTTVQIKYRHNQFKSLQISQCISGYSN